MEPLHYEELQALEPLGGHRRDTELTLELYSQDIGYFRLRVLAWQHYHRDSCFERQAWASLHIVLVQRVSCWNIDCYHHSSALASVLPGFHKDSLLEKLASYRENQPEVEVEQAC